MVGSNRQPIPYSIVSDKPSFEEVLCQPETIHCKKLNKSLLKTITFDLEDDNHRKLSSMEKRSLLHYNKWKFNFTSFTWFSKNLELIPKVLVVDTALLPQNLLVI